jgi:hypothetical protein
MRVVRCAVVVLTAALLVTVARADRTGRVLEVTTTHVALDADGKPVVGGKRELWILPMLTGDGFLLAVRSPAPKAGDPRVLYLAYPLKRGEAAAVRAVAEAGPGCVWEWDRVSVGAIRGEGIHEVECFTVKEGPLKGRALREGGDGSLVLVPPRTPVDKAKYVGRTTAFDNLDDGK